MTDDLYHRRYFNVDKLLKAQLEVSEKRTALAALLDAETPDDAAIETA